MNRDMNLPNEIYTVEAVRQIDRCATENGQISGYDLMTRAAEAAFDVARSEYPDARRWLVICGGGNNAGDGLVLARIAIGTGIDVSVSSLTPSQSLQGDAARAYQDLVRAGGEIVSFSGTLDEQADLLVDALLGNGLTRQVGGRFASAVQTINAHHAPILALDLPSGLNGDSGQVMGVAVRADCTVTFVGLKAGLLTGKGRALAGKLFHNDLAIPKHCFERHPAVLRCISESLLKGFLSPRRLDSHKGDFGHVLVLGGGPGMPGAVRLCGEAALRCGAGAVTIGCHPVNQFVMPATRPELMCLGVASEEELKPMLDRATIIAMGPGMGTSEWASAMFESVLETGKPLVVDADGLNMLSARQCKRDDWVLTPHPGEAGRLLGKTAQEVQSNRVAALGELKDRYGGTVVLKGTGTLVSSADGAGWLCTRGNPGMSGPGMGDVLTGIIAALLAQGLPVDQAAAAGVELHARAGDLAAMGGQRGMLASDLIDQLRTCVNP